MIDQSTLHPGKTSERETDIVLEGGRVQDGSPIRVKGPFDVEEHRGQVAFWLIVLLFALIIGHYSCIVVMEWNGKKVDALNNAFNSALPVVSGLVGSAVTYYFTKIRTSEK
jgi:hypothetical protein